MSSCLLDCTFCRGPFGDTFEKPDEEGVNTRFVTVVIHKTDYGVEHRIHCICALQVFRNQQDLAKEAHRPTCPLCDKKISWEEAARVSGVEGPIECLQSVFRC